MSTYSDASSLLSLTRVSTPSSGETLLTPTEEHPRPLLYGVISPRRKHKSTMENLGAAEIIDAYEASSPTLVHEIIPTSHVAHLNDNETLLPSPKPPSPPPKSPNMIAMHRRRSTKELINLYESNTSLSPTSLCSSAPSSSTQIYSTSTTSLESLGPPQPQAQNDRFGERTPSPIRHSIQNLFGVFGKKAQRPSKEFIVIRPPNKSESVPPQATLPPLKDGQLLYLSRTPTQADAWAHCSATLYAPYLRLAYTRPLPGTPLTYSVNLSKCIEVRSIAANKLDTSLLPNAAGQSDAHVFEVELEGGIKERFASGTIRERGAWVSSIWDVIVSRNSEPAVDEIPGSTSPKAINQRHDPPLRVVNASHISVVSDNTQPAGKRSSFFSSSVSDADLTIMGAPTTSSMAEFKGTHTFKRSTTVRTGLSSSSSNISNYPSSPSIQDLDDKSLVQRRLAHIKKEFDNNGASQSPLRALPSRNYAKVTAYRDEMKGLITRAKSNVSREPARIQDIVKEFPAPSSMEQSLPPQSKEIDDAKSSTAKVRPVSYVSGQGGWDTSSSSLLSSRHRHSASGVTLVDGDPSDTSWRIENPSIDTLSVADSSMTSVSRARDTLSLSPVIELVKTHGTSQAAASRQISDQIVSLHTDLNRLNDDVAQLVNDRDPRDTHAAASMPLVLDDLARLHDKLDTLSKAPPHRGSLEKKLEEIKDSMVTQSAQSSLHEKIEDLKRILTKPTTSAFRDPPPAAIPAPPNSVPAPVIPSFDTAAIMEKLDEISLKEVVVNVQKDPSPSQPVDLSPVMLKLNEIGSDRSIDAFQEHFKLVLKKLDDLKAEVISREHRAEDGSVLQSLGPSQNSDAPPVDLSDIHMKLDHVMDLCRNLTEAVPPPGPEKHERNLSVFRRRGGRNEVEAMLPSEQDPDKAESLKALTGEIHQIVELLNEEKESHVAQGLHQEESVRYLNELNQWFERFVQQHTSQSVAVTDGIQRLLDGLGLSTLSSPAGSIPGSNSASLVIQIYEAVLEMKRHENGDALHNTVDILVQKVEESLQKLLSERQAINPDVIMSIFEMQRQEHERLVRALAEDLSNEIRGERLRFVEAMKEATTVNLQTQILDFKKQLSKEVVGMEQELSDLFALRYLLKTQANNQMPT